MELQELGFTQEELQDRVVDRICERLMTNTRNDDPENPEYTWVESSEFHRRLDEQIKAGIDEAVKHAAETHVLPNVSKYIEDLCLQETSEWGEKRGEPMTFTEYLVARAETYLTEKVDDEGKEKGDSHGFHWKGTQTRITHLVHRHLHYSIESAMKDAMKNANSALVGGIEKTVKMKLKEIATTLKVSATVK